MYSTKSLLTTLVALLPLATGQTITVNPSSLLQQMDGFGVSQAFGRATEFSNLAATPRQQGLDYLFSTSTGAGLTIIRNRIGSGGSGDSILPTSPGSPSGTPKYSWNGVDAGQVWFSKQAMTYGVKTIYADAWSAPGFMKTNGKETSGGYLCGVTGETCSSGDWRQTYANMLVQYVKYYASEGIPITHLGFLNEPDYTTSYSSMLSSGAQSASFIPILSNTLKSSGLSNISMTCCDAVGWNSQKTMTAAIIAAGADKYLSVITSHTYSSEATTPMGTSLHTWITESGDLSDAFCTTWYSSGGQCEGLTWASKIMTGIISAKLSAYLYWEGLELNARSSSSHLIDTDGTTVTPSGRLWAFAMFSRWVRPGAYLLSSSGSVSGVAYGAFKNTDGTIAVVFTNTGSSAQSVTVAFTGYTAASASAWLTDNSHTVASTAVTISGGSVSVSIPARSVVTVKVSANSGTVSSVKPSSSTTTTIGQTTMTSTKTSSIMTMTTTTMTTAIGGAGTQTQYGQCGGTSWSGATTCAAPYACSTLNPYYAQCL